MILAKIFLLASLAIFILVKLVLFIVTKAKQAYSYNKQIKRLKESALNNVGVDKILLEQHGLKDGEIGQIAEDILENKDIFNSSVISFMRGNKTESLKSAESTIDLIVKNYTELMLQYEDRSDGKRIDKTIVKYFTITMRLYYKLVTDITDGQRDAELLMMSEEEAERGKVKLLALIKRAEKNLTHKR